MDLNIPLMALPNISFTNGSGNEKWGTYCPIHSHLEIIKGWFTLSDLRVPLIFQTNPSSNISHRFWKDWTHIQIFHQISHGVQPMKRYESLYLLLKKRLAHWCHCYPDASLQKESASTLPARSLVLDICTTWFSIASIHGGGAYVFWPHAGIGQNDPWDQKNAGLCLSFSTLSF